MCASDFRRMGARCLMAALVLVLGMGQAAAQADKDGEQVKRLRLQLRQVQQQQQAAQEAQAQADQARAKAEQEAKAQESDLKRERANAGSASRRAAALAKELEALKAEHSRVTGELATTADQLKALQASSRKAQEVAVANETDLRTRRDQLTQQLDQCSAHNTELAEVGEALISRYENKGIADVLSEREPFIQTSRVRLENLKAEYGRRIANARVKAAAAPSGTAGTAAP